MALHEYKKCAKIVEEITEYLLGKGYKKINSSLELKDTETTITVTVETNGVPISGTLKQDLFCCRDTELEEYGWELEEDIEELSKDVAIAQKENEVQDAQIEEIKLQSKNPLGG